LLRNSARNIFLVTKGLINRIFTDLTSIDAIIENHFSCWSQPNHQNKYGLKVAISALKNRSSIIVETGTSAHGTDSTRIFDQYIRSFGGRFLSVDLDAYPSHRLAHQMSKKTELLVSDSVNFLSNLQNYAIHKVDLFYLDSRDVDCKEPEASAELGLVEYNAVRHLLHSGTKLVIDSTPNSIHWIPDEFKKSAETFQNRYGVLPCKGAFVIRSLKEDSIDHQVLHHDYNLVIQIV
jgi:hypothetical protein